MTIFWLRDKLHRDTAPVPFLSFVYRDYLPSVYLTCTAIAPAPKKICTWTAKSTPYLSCHRIAFVGDLKATLRKLPVGYGPERSFFFLPVPCTGYMFRPPIKIVPRPRLLSRKFSASYQNFCSVLRQVTQPPFIAGPLAVKFHCHDYSSR